MCCNCVVGLTFPLLLAIPGILQLIPQGYGGNIGLGCSPVPASGVCTDHQPRKVKFQIAMRRLGNDKWWTAWQGASSASRISLLAMFPVRRTTSPFSDCAGSFLSGTIINIHLVDVLQASQGALSLAPDSPVLKTPLSVHLGKSETAGDTLNCDSGSEESLRRRGLFIRAPSHWITRTKRKAKHRRVERRDEPSLRIERG
ncbi:hypothetical protein B0H14DRAFT_2572969 [Mycena olivaceomarginata]|nr:hypothetical protein B0H14DRAFT_2572969 [Mycena olivaceomarginata]